MKEIREFIKGEIGKNIIFLDNVGSTNTYAMELAGKGAPHGTVVITEWQTGGRGRMGRTWISPSGGNLYMSVILQPSIPAEDATLLTLLAGVACCRALRSGSGLPVEIKWPNDLLISGRKVGGILTEIKTKAGGIRFAVVGIGINVNVGTESFPEEVRTIATSLKAETSREQSVELLAAAILNEMDYWHNIMTGGGREKLLGEWRKMASLFGKAVDVVQGDKVLTGIAGDIDERGFLLLRLSSGAIIKVGAGDLTVWK